MTNCEVAAPHCFNERIGYRGNKFMEMKFATPEQVQDNEIFFIMRTGILAMVQSYCESWFDGKEERKQLEWQRMSIMILEVVRNAIEHGNRNDPGKAIWLTMWFGQRGMIVGCRDEGDFFKDPSVREEIKQKAEFPARSFGPGIPREYVADDMRIDIRTGTLFLLMLFREKEKSASA